MLKIRTTNIENIENIKINYNSIECPDNIKPYLKQIMEKCTDYHINTIKQQSIKNLAKQFKSKDESISNHIILSDYKENEKREIKVNGEIITIIFNVKNFERLLLKNSTMCVLINLYNFSHDFNIINKYIKNNLFIVFDSNYIIFGKIWFVFLATPTMKLSLIDYSMYNSGLYKYLNKISVYLNYLYSKINLYVNDESISKKMKIKQILNDKDIRNILKMYNILK